MNKKLVAHIESLIGEDIKQCFSVSGGDIAEAFRIVTKSNVFFCKFHSSEHAFQMFQSEKDGLHAIRATKTVKAPEVYYCEPWEKGAILIMEFVEAGRSSDAGMAALGRQLAQLHLLESSSFGWNRDNFIGSLPQSNRRNSSWSDFYVSERLQPQLELSVKRGLLSNTELPPAGTMLTVMEELCGEVKPSLLHGDLWGGNYLISGDGTPYLVDPAVYEGHSEVDIAMSMLFGGFGNRFYSAYEELLPSDGRTQDRIKLYQLYYLLVHLNLFGVSYYSGVKAIIKSYF